jgi:hypothetical protein
MPIDHAKLPVSDLGVARRFYAAALAPIGWRLVTDAAPSVVHFGAGDWSRVLRRVRDRSRRAQPGGRL